MTYMFKTLMIAVIGAAAFTAQVSTAYAVGSDRDPGTTNLIDPSRSQQRATTQKNTIFLLPWTAGQISSIGNKRFLEQK